jgi:endogenous inhibitor of DNA gyrase (YacG/DUF329 family)
VTGAEQRACPACGTEFTWTSAAPRKKFCSEPCRHRWWGRRRRQATDFLNRGGVPARDSDPPEAAREHAGRGDAPRGTGPRDRGPRGNRGVTAAVPACPHCRKPVAVVAWLVPPAAASVATPGQHAGNST